VHSPVAPDIDGFDVLSRLGRDLPGGVSAKPTIVADWEESEYVTEQERESEEHQLPDDDLFRFSVAGVGLKFSLLSSGDRFSAPAGGVGGDWLIKLPDPTFADLPVNEFATMKLASRAGIDIPEVRLVHRDLVVDVPGFVWGSESLAYGVKRFDRGDKGRVHMEDLAQVRGFYPREKYKGAFETVGNLVFRGRDEESLVEFTRRLAFNIVVGNSDAHLKNWSLLYRDRRRPSISPAYDLVTVSAYGGVAHDLGLNLHGSRSYQDVRLHDFSRLGRRVGFHHFDLADVADDVIALVRANLDETIENLGSATWIAEPMRRHIGKMTSQLKSR